ncbi:type II secretion system F family protein [Brevibacillus marinus]|uniref:type II secretion system F family protein n=1 Tax=Brevibacillus marinus TaxID=2496837 RepID=UPI000F84D016|nr:hypothetical protein [Brevibacillus marinus]
MAILISVCVGMLVLLLWMWSFSGKKEQLKWLQLDEKRVKKKVKFLDEAQRLGVEITPNQYFTWWALAAGVGIAASLLLANLFMIFIALAANYFVIRIYVYQKEMKIRQKAKEQLGPVLMNLASAYRIQKNWERALETIMPMLQDPLKSEFQRAYSAHRSGVPIGEAFEDMMVRLKVPEMRLFVTMAQISDQIGDAAAEGVLVAGGYFQNKRLAAADLANAMLSAVKENRALFFMFVGFVLYFRLFQEHIFTVFMDNFLGKFLLAIYLAVAAAVPIISYMIIRKEV